MVATDFNRDLLSDLVLMSVYGGLVLIPGVADGNFPAPRRLNGASFDLLCGDFNGDGQPDVIRLGPGFGTTLSPLLSDGAGNYNVLPDLTLPDTCKALRSADLNGDGNLDFVACSASAVSIFLGDGRGHFSQTNLPVPNGPSSLQLGDVNGDNFPDQAIGLSRTSQVYTLLNNGQGAFASPHTNPAGTTAQSLTLGDFNGDGKIDLATGDANHVGVQFGNGDGSFQAPALLAVSGLDLQLVDGNGDGIPDLVASGPSEVRILPAVFPSILLGLLSAYDEVGTAPKAFREVAQLLSTVELVPLSRREAVSPVTLASAPEAAETAIKTNDRPVAESQPAPRYSPWIWVGLAAVLVLLGLAIRRQRQAVPPPSPAPAAKSTSKTASPRPTVKPRN